jgi:WD40 repeat protein
VGGAVGFFDTSAGILTGPYKLDSLDVDRAEPLPDRTGFAVAADDGTVWLAAPDRSLRTLVKHQDDINGLLISPDGTAVLTFTESEVGVVEIASNDPAKVFRPFDEEIVAAAPVSRDLFVVAADSGDVRLIRAGLGNTVWRTSADSNAPVKIAVSPRGEYLATVLRDDTVSIRRLLTDPDKALAYYCANLNREEQSTTCPTPTKLQGGAE